MSYFIGQRPVSLAFIMVGSLLIGYLIGVVSLSATMLKQKLKIKHSERKLEQKTKEVENLRSLPIKDDY